MSLDLEPYLTWMFTNYTPESHDLAQRVVGCVSNTLRSSVPVLLMTAACKSSPWRDVFNLCPCYCGKTIKGILTITRLPYDYEVDMAVLNVVHPLVVVSSVPRPTVSAAVSWCAPHLRCSIIPPH